MPHSTIDAARDWLKSNGKRPKRAPIGCWYWSVAGNPFAEGDTNVLPAEVFQCLTDAHGTSSFAFRTHRNAVSAAAEAVARAMREGWRPEKGD